MRLLSLVIAGTLLAFLAVSDADGQEEGPDYSREGADTCLSCHESEAMLAIFRTRHAVPSDSRSPFGQGQLQCEACHGPGGDHAGRVRRGQERPAIPFFHFGSTATVEEQNGQCLGCHNSGVGFGWHAGEHPVNEVACVDCHQMHVARDPVLQTATQPEVCFDCHQAQRTQSMKAFAHPFFQDKMDCAGCHSPHGDEVATSLVRQTVNDTCYQCHAEQRGPYLWEHAPVSEDCTLCHSPHGSNHPGMLAKRAPLLCQSCHSQFGHPSIPLGPDELVTGTPSRFLLGQSCLNCHSQVHGSNHPSGSRLMR